MRTVFFVHSLLSDWNHGNAHFLRGVATELVSRGHEYLSPELIPRYHAYLSFTGGPTLKRLERQFGSALCLLSRKAA